MRKSINHLFRLYYKQRYKSIQHYMRFPHEVQQALLRQLIETTRHTVWGKLYDYQSIRDINTFMSRIPISHYEDVQPYISRMMHGEKDVLWSGHTRWFAKSSGTTDGKSKYIPVTSQSRKYCHIRGTWDTMTMFYHNRPDAKQFECKSLVMGGALERFPSYPKTMIGDVSAIMISHMPFVGRPFYIPDFKTALLSDWEVKLEKLAKIAAATPDVVMIGGVPTWTVVLLRRILELTGKQNLLEVWPQAQGYIHGGVSFIPYREQFRAFFPSSQFSYQETYNASEGFFAVQDDFKSKDMLLLLDNGIYYEFLPVEEWSKEYPKAIPLAEVETGKNYALVISTNAGLWRYVPGDTVTFTSTYPYKIQITGRTKQFVNAFGEEVMVDNTDRALAETCAATHATVVDYTVAPIYFGEKRRGRHEWLIEFEHPPANMELFNQMLDENLQAINSDYEAKRYKGLALSRLKLTVLPRDTFQDWMRAKGKLGGQHKVPRLANDRKVIDDILTFATT